MKKSIIADKRLCLGGDLDHTFVHIGSSMNPILRAPDLVRVEPYNSREIKVGDVIIFRSPHAAKNISHRVVRIEGDKVFTQGDNNNQADKFFINPRDIIGRVVQAERGGKRLSIYGGKVGLALGLFCRMMRRAKSALFFVLRPVYLLLGKANFIKLTPQALTFKRFGGTELQLVLGRLVVGRWHSGKKQWDIRTPFKLFINV